jgi:hypothetical protein
MVCWQQEEPYRKVIHIHGDKDIIFPIKNINDCVVLEGGTHIMLLDRGKQLSAKLVAAIEE